MTATFSHAARRFTTLRRGTLLALVAILLALTPLPASSQTTSKEYQLKAVFIFNFVQFVDWPSNTFADANAPFRIGILGDNPFGSALDETVSGETVHGRKIVIVRATRAESLSDCQIIFISRSERNHLNDIIATIDHHPVLTVSEMDDFAQRGGIINFYLDENKVRFEINPATARACNLVVSSQLLSVGKVVGDSPGGKR
ncbi:MAG TPA: YfiR family protein [Verrucomicrobiae bacterium]|jgi:hypothetical protein|nr:YfiR family protein [Verrucomicrobiae bacterium]